MGTKYGHCSILLHALTTQIRPSKRENHESRVNECIIENFFFVFGIQIDKMATTQLDENKKPTFTQALHWTPQQFVFFLHRYHPTLVPKNQDELYHLLLM